MYFSIFQAFSSLWSLYCRQSISLIQEKESQILKCVILFRKCGKSSLRVLTRPLELNAANSLFWLHDSSPAKICRSDQQKREFPLLGGNFIFKELQYFAVEISKIHQWDTWDFDTATNLEINFLGVGKEKVSKNQP